MVTHQCYHQILTSDKKIFIFQVSPLKFEPVCLDLSPYATEKRSADLRRGETHWMELQTGGRRALADPSPSCCRQKRGHDTASPEVFNKCAIQIKCVGLDLNIVRSGNPYNVTEALTSVEMFLRFYTNPARQKTKGLQVRRAAVTVVSPLMVHFRLCRLSSSSSPASREKSCRQLHSTTTHRKK